MKTSGDVFIQTLRYICLTFVIASGFITIVATGGGGGGGYNYPDTVLGTISVGNFPDETAITLDGNYVYVVNHLDDTVSVIGYAATD